MFTQRNLILFAVLIVITAIVGCQNPAEVATTIEVAQDIDVQVETAEPITAETHYNNGVSSFDKGEYDQAIADYTQAITLDPNYTEAYHNRGMTYRSKGNYDQAISDYTQAITLNPDSPQTSLSYNGRGIAYADQKEYDQAIVDFTEAIVLDPDYAEAYHNRGLTYHNKGNYDQALSDYAQTIALDPEYILAYSNRGLLYYIQKKYDQAIIDYTQAIALDPDYAMPYISRGIVYSEQKEYDQAIADFTEGIILNPDDAMAYINRGLTYSFQENYDQAIIDFTHAIDLDSDYAETYIQRANAYRELGNTDAADADQAIYESLILTNAPGSTSISEVPITLIPFESAVGKFNIEYPSSWTVSQDTTDEGTVFVSPTSLDYIFIKRFTTTDFGTEDPIELLNLFLEGLGLGFAGVDADVEIKEDPIVMKINSYDGVMAHITMYETDFQIFIAVDGRRMSVIMTAAQTYSAAEYDPIIQAIVNTFSFTEPIEPTTAEEYTNRGVTCYDMGNYDQAIADFTEAIKLDPNFAEAYHWRGFAYFDQGNYDQAIEDYTQELAIDPDYAQAYYERGLNYYTQGDYEQAINDYTDAIALNPSYSMAYSNRGLTYHAQENYDQAIADYTKAITLNPDAITYSNRGHAYYEQGDYDQAITDCTQAINLDPDFAMAYNNRGLAYHAQENYDKAIADYTQAIDLDPDIVKAYLHRVITYKELENMDDTFGGTGSFNSGDTQIRSIDNATMVYIPDATFTMGENEKLIDDITLNAFWIDQTEVTNEQYELCVVDGICRQPTHFDSDYSEDQHPVVGINWYDASAYCVWANGRLPTETEWEYAARGPENNTYPWGNDSPTCDLLNYDNTCVGKTTIVGSYSPDGDSWIGIADMAGNVWEWVDGQPDYRDDDPTKLSDEELEALRGGGELKVLRGGGYTNDKDAVQSTCDAYFPSTSRFSAIGFRCASSAR